MVANDQAYDSHAAQGLLLNNDKSFAGKEVGGTARDLIYMGTDDRIVIGESGVYLDLPFQPRARVYRGANQTNLTNDALTKVLLDTEDYDVGGNFASNKFTVPTGGDGLYLIMGSIAYEGLVAQKAYAAYILKNGSSIARNVNVIGGETGWGFFVPVESLENLVATDYIELHARSHADVDTVDITGGTDKTWLEIMKVA